MDAFLRGAHLNRARISRLLLALVVVPLALIAVLLMHTITSDGAAASPTLDVPITTVHDSGSDSLSPDVPVTPQQGFEALVCVFALLVGVLFLALPAVTPRIGPDFLPVRRPREGGQAVRQPRPQIYELSIIRT